jgi:predicted metal-binding protein
MSTSNYTIQIHDAICDKWLQEKKRATRTSGTKEIQELNPNTSENYLLNSISVCVCVCVCVCRQSSPSMVMVSKQCSYTFTPAFSFMACTGTALTSSSLGYRNLNCTTV